MCQGRGDCVITRWIHCGQDPQDLPLDLHVAACRVYIVRQRQAFGLPSNYTTLLSHPSAAAVRTPSKPQRLQCNG